MPVIQGTGLFKPEKDPLGLYSNGSFGLSRPAGGSATQPVQQPQRPQQAAPLPNVSGEDWNALVNTVIAEAGGEGPEGMAAVAHVIANRANTRGQSLGEVVRAPHQFEGYSNPGSASQQAQQDPAMRAQAEEIVRNVLAGTLPDPTGGADHFHNGSVSPDWAAAMSPTAQIGGHQFYASSARPQQPQSDALRAIDQATQPPQPPARPNDVQTSQPQRSGPFTNAQGEDYAASQAVDLASLSYTNQNAQRSLPLIEPLAVAIQEDVARVYGPGYRVEVMSGGQGQGSNGSTGSRRHNDGYAGDVWVYDPNGRRLSPDELIPLSQHWVASGRGSVGFPANGQSLHLDFIGGNHEHALPLQRGEGRIWYYGNPSQTQRSALNAALNDGVLPSYAGGGPARTQITGNRIVVDPDFRPSDPLGLYSGRDNPLAIAAPQPEPVEQDAGNPEFEQIEQGNAQVQQQWQQLESQEPGRYRVIDQADYDAWRQEWEANQPGMIEDMFRQLGGGAVEGTGLAVRGLGEMAAAMHNVSSVAAVNAIFGTDFEMPNFLEAPADALQQHGEGLKTGVSWATQEAIRLSSPDGDLMDPSTWTFGEEPSLVGYTALALDVFGQMTPVIAASIAAGPVGGAVAGGAQGGGAAVQEAHQLIDEMAARPGVLEENSAYYRELLASGMSHEEALERTKDAAGQTAMLLTAPISAVGGYATGALINPATSVLAGQNIVARITGRAAISALEEGTQEAAESVATRAGTNIGAGTDVDVTEGTFGDFVLGALAGGAAGGIGGALSRRQQDQGPQATPATETPRQPASDVEVNLQPDGAPAAEGGPDAAPAQRRGPLTTAVQDGARQTATGQQFMVDDFVPGLGAGEMHGQTVELSSDQSDMPAGMVRVILPDGTPHPIGERLLVPMGGEAPTAAMPDSQITTGPVVRAPAGSTTAAPERGQRGIVEIEGMDPFGARVEDYVEGESGTEAIIVTDDGEVMQIPAEAVRSQRLTEQMVQDLERQENPPVERDNSDANPETSRQVLGSNIEFPDATHAALFDLGAARRQAQRLSGATALDMRESPVGRDAVSRIADELGILPERVNDIADDYRYRVERSARRSNSELPTAMHPINASMLQEARAERQRAERDAPAATSGVDLAARWDALHEDERQGVLSALGIRRSPRTRWEHFPVSIRRRLQPQVEAAVPRAPEAPPAPEASSVSEGAASQRRADAEQLLGATAGDVIRTQGMGRDLQDGSTLTVQSIADDGTVELSAPGGTPATYSLAELRREAGEGVSFERVGTRPSEPETDPATRPADRGAAIDADAAPSNADLFDASAFPDDREGAADLAREQAAADAPVTYSRDEAGVEAAQQAVRASGAAAAFVEAAREEAPNAQFLALYREHIGAAMQGGGSDGISYQARPNGLSVRFAGANGSLQTVVFKGKELADALRQASQLEAQADRGQRQRPQTEEEAEAEYNAARDEARAEANRVAAESLESGEWMPEGARYPDEADLAEDIRREREAQADIPQVQPETIAPIDDAANEAATSPLNDLPEPSQAQKEAGNYRVGKVSLGGLELSIENPAGSFRRGVDRDGNAWQVEMKSHYGYIRGTVGRDKDHIDIFVRPGTAALDANAPIFVVDQVDGDTRRFDEHKVMAGFDSLDAAREAYMANYTEGWNGLGEITETTLEDFKAWLADGDTTKRFATRDRARASRTWDPETLLAAVKRENYTRAIADEAPVLFRETDADGLERLLSGQLNLGPMGQQELYWSNVPELALGQGRNRGFIAVADAEGINGRVNKKPGWEAAWPSAEYVSRSGVTGRSVKAVLVKGDTQVPKALARLLAGRFDAQQVPAGTLYTLREGGSEAVSEGINALRAMQSEPSSADAAPTSPAWWDNLSADDRQALLDRAEVKRSPKSKWDGFTPAIRRKLEAAREQAPAEPSTGPIEDFGEEIGGARKHMAAALTDQLREKVDLATTPLSEAFPRPDYPRLARDGVAPEVLALVAVLRDSIPNKPRKGYKVDRWVADVDLKRLMARRLMEGEAAVDDIRKRLANSSSSDQRAIGLIARAIEGLPPEKMAQAAKWRISSGSYSVFGGQRFDKPKTMYYLVDPDGRMAMARSGVESATAYDETEAGIIEKARTFISDAVDQQDGAGSTRSKYTTVNLYRDRSSNELFIGFKNRSNVIRLKSGFADAKEARAYAEENRDALQAKIDEMRRGPNLRRSSNAARTGREWREGDVTPEQFDQVFGFRGVQFGNYVEGPRRQADLNQAYDALMDLADAVGLPPRALSLNGTLGLAFGARGRGGRNAAAAHYESGQVVINLTKNSGPGSLAHEWLHALDNYFGRQDGGGAFMSAPGQRGGKARAEIREAWEGVRTAVREPSFLKRSQEFDQARSKPYFATPIEMAARAFERYIVDRLETQGAVNDYLANIDLDGGAYPNATEMQAGIREAYDRLFSTIETERTESGNVRLYSRAARRPVVELEGNEMGVEFRGAEDMPALRRAATKWFDENLRGQTATMRDGTEVSFTRKGMGKSTSVSKGDLLLRSVPAIRPILENGEVVYREPGRKSGVSERLIVSAPVTLNGNTMQLAVSVHRTAAGQYQYDLTFDRDVQRDGQPRMSRGGLAPDGSLPSLEMPQPAPDLNLVEWDRERNAVGGQPALANEMLADTLGPVAQRMIDAGMLRIGTAAELRAEEGVQGWTDPDGSITLVSDQITPGEAMSVLLHEAFHSGARPLLGEQAWQGLMGRLRGLYRQFEASSGKARAFYDAARSRVDDARAVDGRMSEDLAVEEFGAYAIEEYASAPSALKRWVDDVLGAIKAWALRRFGRQIGQVTPAQLRAIAQAALNSTTGPMTAQAAQSRRESRAGYSADPDSSTYLPPSGGRQALGKALRAVKRLPNGLRDMDPTMLALVPLNYFTELKLPGMKGIDAYLKAKRSMDAYRGNKHGEMNELAQRWRKYTALGWGPLRSQAKRSRAEHLADLMHDSTLAGIDPSKTDEETKKKYGYDALRERYLAMPAQGRALFMDVRDAYKAQQNELDQILLENVQKVLDIATRKAQERYRKELKRIADEKLSGLDRSKAIDDAQRQYTADVNKAKFTGKARMTKLRQQFEQSRVEEPYFPLARFGRYFISVKDVNGDVVSFSRRENDAERADLVAEMSQAYPASKGYKITSGVIEETASAREAMDPAILAEIDKILGKADVPESVMDQVYQRYLMTMPDMSVRKRFIHRKGTPGYGGDALRAFGNHMFHASHQMARLKYGPELEDYVRQTVAQAKEADEADGRGYGMDLANELKKRHAWNMNPMGSSVTQKVNSMMFVWYLGATPAAAMVNITQTPMLGIPILGARLGGAGKAAAALTRASADLVRGRGSVTRSKLSAEERRALDAFYESGLIDRTQSHDLAGVGETGVEYSPVRHKVMNVISWMYHQAEVVNREVTALAAYRMARAQGQSEFAAIDTAHDLTWKTHFDYSSGSRARALQSDAARMLLVFQSHSLNIWYRLARDFHQAFKGESPQVRKEARYQLAGIMGMQTLMGGVKGFFGYNIITAMLGMLGLFDDDDDPRKLRDRFESDVIDLFGPDLGGIILNGAPGHLTGIDLSSRVGMMDFFLRTPDNGNEGRDLGQEVLVGLTGASGATFVNFFDGFDLARQGKLVEGLEVVAPKFLRDLAKGARYQSEGLRTRSGNVLLEADEIPWMDSLRKALGFQPARVAEVYERNSALYEAANRVNDERSGLIGRFADAVINNDAAARNAAIADIAEWNQKGYARAQPITSDTVTASLRTRLRNLAKREDGVLIQNDALSAYLRLLMPETVYR